MKKILFTTLLLFIYLITNAQSDFRKGYVITDNLDTIHGTIDFRNDMKNSEECIFTTPSGSTTTYRPGEIYGYRFENGRYYVSKFVKETNGTVAYRFVEFLVQGAKDLYYFRDMAGFHYLLDYKPDTLTEIPYKAKDINKDGKDYRYESKQYIGYLKEYFKDCPSVYPEIDRIKKPGFNNLITLTKDYHYKTCSDSSCIVYYQPKPVFKVAFEPQYGWITSMREFFPGNTRGFSQTGLMIYFWLPRANEKLYLKTGYSYAEYTTQTNSLIYSEKEKYNFLKIPFQFEYLFPDWFIRPKFDFGVNFYSLSSPYSSDRDKALFLAGSVGSLVTINKHIYLDLSLDSDISTISIRPYLFDTFAFNAGIYLQL